MEESSLISMENNEPEIITDKEQMRKWSRSMRAQGKTIGLIPTMGYLHHGHISLIQEAQKHTQLTVVSIYVNPGQFSPSEDLSTYPSDFQGDIEKLKALPSCVDVVFHPKNLYDYGNNSSISDESNIEEGKEGGGEKAVVTSCIEESDLGHETWVRVEKLEKGMCGKSRPVFFRGVATVVTKLFNIVEPDFAVFGKKDYQQWQIIRRMVRDLDFSINVIGLEIVRDADGLAMSSRNVHLSPEEREKALSINKSLLEAKLSAQKGQVSCRVLRNSVTQAILEAGGKIDYAEIVDQENLEAVEEIESPVVFCVAAWFGKVRLIDNMEISPPTSTECSVVEPAQLDYTDIFTTTRIFTSRDALIKWVRDMGRRHGLIIVTMRSDSGNGERPARLFLCCERSGSYKKRSKNTTEEGDNTTLAKVASTKKCGCPFKLKGERVSTSDEWILFVVCGEHNHSTTTHMEGRSYAGKLHDDETSLLVDMTKNSAKPKEILTILKQRDAYNASTIKTIYNARRKYKKSEKGRRLEV